MAIVMVVESVFLCLNAIVVCGSQLGEQRSIQQAVGGRVAMTGDSTLGDGLQKIVTVMEEHERKKGTRE